jgi:hypothetical protein
MASSQLSAVFQSAVGLAILFTMLLIWVPALRLDIFRQKMFSLRDEFFDYAKAGKIQFDHPAYLLLRKSMNGFLRYGHRLSFFQLCITFCRWRILEEKPAMEWSQRWEAALGSIENGQTRKDLEAFHARAMDIVIDRLIIGSPLLFCSLVASMIVVALGLLAKGAWLSMAELYRMAIMLTFRFFAIDPNALEDEALRSASLA